MGIDRAPLWLRKRILVGKDFFKTRDILSQLSVATVCESARCPNLHECFSKKVATFLILGKTCTRRCSFCSVGKGTPGKVDPHEPVMIAEAVRRLGLAYAVITSVTRDDLGDGGAAHFVDVVASIRRVLPDTTIELLIPDFAGLEKPLEMITDAGPDVIGHNIETVERFYPYVRPVANYHRSLKLLRRVKEIAPHQTTKSGIMLGLGESEDDTMAAIHDIRSAGCDILTLGQYLRPGPENVPVQRFIALEEFDAYKKKALAMGFRQAVAGPFVRSSYRSEETYKMMGENAYDKRYFTAAC